jgi:protein gp37
VLDLYVKVQQHTTSSKHYSGDIESTSYVSHMTSTVSSDNMWLENPLRMSNPEKIYMSQIKDNYA